MSLRTWAIAGPLLLLGVLFALANQTLVRISFDPFSPASPAVATPGAPLWLVLFIVFVIGFAVGASAMWVSGGRLRRKARARRREIERLKTAGEAAARSPAPVAKPPAPLT